MDTTQEIQKYSKAARVFHWVHVAAFLILSLTGILLIIEPLTFMAIGGWSRLIHRITAIVFILAPLIELIANKETSVYAIKTAFKWGKEDLDWVMAMPGYFFMSDDTVLPPQDEMNTGQKLWFLCLLILGPVLVITGILMWILRTPVAQPVFQLSVLIHDFAFIVIFLMFLIHLYLDVIHPMTRIRGGSLKAMTRGTVTRDFARTHHQRWYERAIYNKK
jgi:formate dehydrogenase subunit gamma